MSFSLSNRAALITGSTRGLGLGIAESIASAGAKVALNYYGNREVAEGARDCLLYTSPSPRDKRQSRMPSSA